MCRQHQKQNKSWQLQVFVSYKAVCDFACLSVCLSLCSLISPLVSHVWGRHFVAVSVMMVVRTLKNILNSLGAAYYIEGTNVDIGRKCNYVCFCVLCLSMCVCVHLWVHVRMSVCLLFINVCLP